MIKDLLVRISASVGGLKKGLDDAVKVTQTASNKIDASSNQISDSLNKAFGGNYRKEIDIFNNEINSVKLLIIDYKSELVELEKQYKKVSKETGKDSLETKKLGNEINRVKGEIKTASLNLNDLNRQLRDQKTNLANSRLAAEDNSSAMESLSRITTAVTGAVLLLGEGNESLQPIMKGVRIAVAGLNAVVAIQNLRLRENARFLGLLNSGLAGLNKAISSANVAFMTFAGLGLLYAIQNYDQLLNLIGIGNNTLSDLQTNYDEVTDSIISQSIEINALTRDVNNNNISEENRLLALKKLQSQYPAYFKDLGNDINDTKKLIQQKNILISALLAEAKLKSAKTQLESKLKPYMETDFELQDKLYKIQDKRAKLDAKALNLERKKFVEKKNLTAQEQATLTETRAIQASLFDQESALLKRKQENQVAIDNLTNAYYRYADSIKSTTKLLDEDSNKDTKNKELKIKSAEDILSSQEKLVLDEIKLQGDKNKLLKKTDEERLRSDFITQKRLLDVQEEFAKERLDASDKSVTDLNTYYAEIARINNERLANETSYENGLNNLRDKAIAEQIKDEKNRLLAIEEAKEGTLKVYDRYYEKEKDKLAKQYNEGKIDYKTYQDGLNKIQLDSLNKRKELLEGFGEEITGIEQQIADLQAKIREQGGEELTKVQIKLIKDAAKAIRSAFNSLLTDIGQGLQESLMRAMQGTDEAAQISLEILKMRQKELEQIMNDARSSEMEILQARQQYLQNQEQIAEQSKDNLTQTFDSMLMAIGDFLIKLGSGLVAAAVATKAFQDLLIANPVAALAAGAAAVALGTIVKATLTEGVAFANGGIVSGPTLGLVGEYPGASTNPEVIAPLDKLKNMLNIGGNGNDGYIAETRVSGRDLAIVLNRYNQDSKRG